MRSRITPNKHLAQFKTQKAQFAGIIMTELRKRGKKDRLPTARAGGRSLYTVWIQNVYTIPEICIHAAAVGLFVSFGKSTSRLQTKAFAFLGFRSNRLALLSPFGRNRRPADRLGLRSRFVRLIGESCAPCNALQHRYVTPM